MNKGNKITVEKGVAFRDGRKIGKMELRLKATKDLIAATGDYKVTKKLYVMNLKAMRYRREGNEKAPARSARPVTPQKDESSDESDSGTSDELSEKKSNIDDLDNEARKSIETSGNEAEGPKVVLHIIDQNAISNAVKRAPKRGHAKAKKGKKGEKQPQEEQAANDSNSQDENAGDVEASPKASQPKRKRMAADEK